MSVPRPLLERPRAAALLALGILTAAAALTTAFGSAGWASGLHYRTIVVFVVALVAGELVRLRMPSRREAAPLASASALALAFVGDIAGEPTFDVPSGVVVLVVAAGVGLAAGGGIGLRAWGGRRPQGAPPRGGGGGRRAGRGGAPRGRPPPGAAVEGDGAPALGGSSGPPLPPLTLPP